MSQDIAVSFSAADFDRLLEIAVEAIKMTTETLPSGQYIFDKEKVEFEMRLGVPKSYDKERAKWSFNSSVDIHVYKAVKEFLIRVNDDTHAPYFVQTIEIKSVDDTTQVRKITEDNGDQNYSISYDIKKKIKSFDELVMISDIHPQKLEADEKPNPNLLSIMMLRFALARENSDQNIAAQLFERTPGPVTFRHRTRSSYFYTNIASFDLSSYDDGDHSIECEYKPSTLKSIPEASRKDKGLIFKNLLFPPLKSLMDHITDSRVIWGANSVTIKYNELLRQSMGLRDEFSALRREGRPQNIAIHEIPRLTSGYSFTNKLNGLFFRLLIAEFRYNTLTLPMIFLFSDTDIRFVAIDQSDVKAYDTKAAKSISMLNKFVNTLIDVELFQPTFENNEIHAFDCLLFQGRNMTMASHDQRMRAITPEFTSFINEIVKPYFFTFEVKKFFYTNNVLSDLDETVKYMTGRYGARLEELNDGIIMTPMGQYEYVDPKSRNKILRNKVYYDTQFPIYKWKFPSAVSIDFLIKSAKPASMTKMGKYYRVFDLLSAGMAPFGPFELQGKRYYPPSVLLTEYNSELDKTLKDGQVVELAFDRPSNSFRLLKIRTDKTVPNTLITAQKTFVDMADEFTLQKFRNYIAHPETIVMSGSSHPVSLVTSTPSMPASGQFPPQAKGGSKPFVPTGSSSISGQGSKTSPRPPIMPPAQGTQVGTIGQSGAISRPLAGTSASSAGEKESCLSAYRDFHNRIKTGLIRIFTDNKQVLDLGAGKGGDLSKFYNAGVRFLWAVEPNSEYINGPKGFKDRLKIYSKSLRERKFRDNVSILNLKAEDTAKITNALLADKEKYKLASSQAQVISAFFSLTFFFQNKATLDALINTVASNLSEKGVFIGTVLDGHAVFNAIGHGNPIESPGCYYIKPRYDAARTLRLPNVGAEIVINLSGTPTVQGDQTEWLVNFKYLIQELAKKNIILRESLPFTSPKLFNKFTKPRATDPSTEELYATMSEPERKLNALYRYFVFEKVPPTQVQKRREIETTFIEQQSKNLLERLEPGDIEEGQFVQSAIYPAEVHRVGVLGKGSCFFHALIFALTGKSNPKLAKQLRTSLGNFLSPIVFRQLASGAIESTTCRDYIRATLIKYLITNEKNPEITKDQLNDIINGANGESSIASMIQLITTSLDSLGYEKADIDRIIEIGRLRCMESYANRIKDESIWTEHNTMEYIMTTLRYNIFVVRDIDRLPVKFTDCKNYNPKWPCVIMINLQGGIAQTAAHFEPIITVEEVAGKEKINLLFKWESPLVQALYKQLCVKPMEPTQSVEELLAIEMSKLEISPFVLPVGNDIEYTPHSPLNSPPDTPTRYTPSSPIYRPSSPVSAEQLGYALEALSLQGPIITSPKQKSGAQSMLKGNRPKYSAVPPPSCLLCPPGSEAGVEDFSDSTGALDAAATDTL